MGTALFALVSVSLSLSGFGIDANNNAPGGAEVVRYAPEQADFMVYLDLEAVAPKNYQALVALANSTDLRALPDMQRELKSLVGQLEMGLGMVRGAVGIDPIRDPKSVAAWVKYPAKGTPSVLVHVRGSFPRDLVDKIAAAAGGQKTVKIAGRTAILEDGMLLVSAADGSLLFGSEKWVRASATGARRTPPRRGAAQPKTARMLDGKPFFALVSTPSKAALGRIGREMAGSGDNALSDLFSGHSYAALTMSHNGVGWTYTATTNSGLDRAAMASRGLLQLMRASHYAGRGLANVFFASIDSYRGKSRELDSIIRVKADLMKLVDEFTGDGKFAENVDVNRRGRTVSVSATGRSLSDVVPLIGLAPIGAGWAMFTVRASAPMIEEGAKPSVRPAPPRPRKMAPRKKAR